MSHPSPYSQQARDCMCYTPEETVQVLMLRPHSEELSHDETFIS